MTFREKVFLGIIVLVSVFLNTFRLSSIPAGLHGDEAHHGLQALEILEGKNHLLDFGWYGLPIPSFLGQAAGIWALGRTIVALRISSALIGALTLIPFYFLARLFFDRRTAYFSTVLLATSHWWIAMSRLGENYIQVPFFATLGFLLIVLGFQKKNPWLTFLAGLAIGANMYLYFAARLTPLLSLLFIVYLVWTSNSKAADIKLCFLLFLGFSLLFIPFAISASNHTDFSFSRQNDVYIFSTGQGGQWRQKTYSNQNLRQVLEKQTLRIFSYSTKWQDTSGQYGYRGWIIDPVSGALFLFGMFGIIVSRQKIKFFPLIWIAATIFAGWILTENPPFSPRIVGMFPALFLIAGYGLKKLLRMIKEILPLFQIPVAIIFVTSIAVINIHAYFVRGVREQWGDPNKYIATSIASYMNTLPNYSMVFLTAPSLHADYGSIQYLAPRAKIVSIDSPSSYRPTRVTQTLFIILPEYEFLVSDIMAANPGGDLRKTLSPLGKMQVIFYRVD